MLSICVLFFLFPLLLLVFLLLFLLLSLQDLWDSPYLAIFFCVTQLPDLNQPQRCLFGWCILGVFWLLVFTCLRFECQDLLSLCGMNAQTRPCFLLGSERAGSGVRTDVNSQVQGKTLD